MLYQEGKKLFLRFDKELLCIEAYGADGFRIRATQLRRDSEQNPAV